MSDALRMEEIKKTHEQLFQKALNQHIELLKDQEKLQAFVNEQLDPFLSNVERLALGATSQEDYNWLNDAAMKWQVVLSSVLNIPRTIQISAPAHRLEPSPSARTFSSQELNEWVEKRAAEFSRRRRMSVVFRDPQFIDRIIDRIPSSAQEMDLDWHNANVDFALEVLYGSIDFAQRLQSKTYDRLEKVWLSEVKRLRAYFIWERRGAPWDLGEGKLDYYQSCQELRELLVNSRFKASPAQFQEAQAYLQTQYLTEGKVAWEQKQADSLLNARMQRAVGDWDDNRRRVKSYVTLFYDNIIPAVTRADSESISAVLKALQFGTLLESRFPIINCFEAALAIYFLDRGKVLDVWEHSPDRPSL